jgi:TrmH family RNA methyltransferase
MISKAKSKYIKSLQVKKYRIQEQRFLVEGAKSVEEVLNSSFEVELVVATESFLAVSRHRHESSVEWVEAKGSELESIGSLQSNDAALAVAKMKPNKPLHLAPKEYGLVLDDLRDPGNLGTIVRTADWYGIRKIVASPETADFYSPKSISATMGSFCRVEIYYCPLAEFLRESKIPIYGTFLDGQSVHGFNFASEGWVVIGNESRGISRDIQQLVTVPITIPRFGKAESLNAGVATAVILDNLRRSQK